MRPLSPTAITRAAAAAQSPVWLLRLWTDSTAWHFAIRAATYDDVAYAPLLTENLHWREALKDGDLPGGHAAATLSAEIINAAGSSSLREALPGFAPGALHAQLFLAWLDAAVSPLDTDDAILLFRGALAHWSLTPHGITLVCEDTLTQLGRRPLGRRLRTEMIPGAYSPSLNQPIPWVIGRHERMPLFPLEQGATIHLTADLLPSSLDIRVDTLAGIPTSGTVQIGAEFITYTSVDPTNLTLGVSGSGVTRSDPTLTHFENARVRVVPSGGFTWIIADHACSAIEEVQGDGIVIDPANYSIGLRTIDGIDAHVLTMPTWPINAADFFYNEITVTVQGIEFGGGMIDNPVDVLQWMLTSPRVFNLDSGLIDPTTFVAAQSATAALSAKVRRRLRGDETLSDMLNNLLRECGLWLSGADLYRVTLATATPDSGDTVTDITTSHMLQLKDATQPHAIASALPHGAPPAAIELHRPAEQHGHILPVYQYPAADIHGALPRRIAIEWLDLTGDFADAIIQLAYAHAHTRAITINLTVPLNLTRLLPAETINLDPSLLGLSSTAAWVHQLEFNLSKTPFLQITLRE